LSLAAHLVEHRPMSGAAATRRAALCWRRRAPGSRSRAAWGGFIRAARLIAGEGRFDAFADAAATAEVNGFFRSDLDQRTLA